MAYNTSKVLVWQYTLFVIFIYSVKTFNVTVQWNRNYLCRKNVRNEIHIKAKVT